MSEFKGTQGDWIYSKISEESNGYINIEIPMGSISVYNGFYLLSFEKDKEKCTEILEANAKLISCAPEMFEMLKVAKSTISRLKNSIQAHPDCVEDSEFEGYVGLGNDTIDKIEFLIKKATEL